MFAALCVSDLIGQLWLMKVIESSSIHFT